MPSMILAEVMEPSASLVVQIALSSIFSVVMVLSARFWVLRGGKILGEMYTRGSVITKDTIAAITTI